LALAASRGIPIFSNVFGEDDFHRQNNVAREL